MARTSEYEKKVVILTASVTKIAKAMLTKIARKRGLSKSDVVEMAIRRMAQREGVR